MKKLILLVAALFATFLVNVNAQYFVGGSLALNSNARNTDTSTDYSTGVDLHPEFGYSLNPKLDIGLSLTLSFAYQTAKVDNYNNSSSYFGWGIAPFVRYSFIEWKKFKVLGKGEFFVNSTSSESAYATYLGVNIVPVLQYDLSDHFALTTNLYFLSLNTHYYNANNSESYYFGLGVNSNNLIVIGDSFSIGFLYKF